MDATLQPTITTTIQRVAIDRLQYFHRRVLRELKTYRSMETMAVIVAEMTLKLKTKYVLILQSNNE
jgi:hypothetical protein